MRDSYGILLTTFWDGDTGQKIQAAGKDPVILALFLSANEFANMIGLYELSFSKLARRLPVLKGAAAIRRAFEVLARERFAYFDPLTEFVWVREMARVRMNLNGEPLADKDNRRIGAEKLYYRLPSSPYLGPFFDRYALELALKRKREGGSEGASQGDGQGDGQGDSEGDSKAPSVSPHTPLQVPGTSEIRDQESGTSGISNQESDRTAAAPPRSPNGKTPRELAMEPNGDNFAVISALAREAIAEGIPEDELVETVKARASIQWIDYGRISGQHNVVHRAVDSELFKAKHNLVGSHQ